MPGRVGAAVAGDVLARCSLQQRGEQQVRPPAAPLPLLLLLLLRRVRAGHCAGLVHGRASPQPVPSYVHLNFSCNVVVTRSTALAGVFERALHVFSRPVDPAIEMGAQQVSRVCKVWTQALVCGGPRYCDGGGSRWGAKPLGSRESSFSAT